MKTLVVGDRVCHPWHGSGEIWAMTSLGIYVRFDVDNAKPGEATSTRLVWPSELTLVDQVKP